MILHLCTSTFKITNSHKKELSIDEARQAWVLGKVTDCNLGFQRLALHYDFDVKALQEFYDNN